MLGKPICRVCFDGSIRVSQILLGSSRTRAAPLCSTTQTGGAFCVEWAHNVQVRGKMKWNQWRAQDAKRLAALGGTNPDEPMRKQLEPDLLTYRDTLRIFEAFLRREPRPAQYSWRNINHIVAS